MLRVEIPLMVAPVGMQPGAYVPKAYAGLVTATTPTAELEVERARGWRVRLRWQASQPVRSLDGDPGRFVDACAVLTGETLEAPWITMGMPNHAVVGALWRADRPRPVRIRAQGLGTVERSDPPDGWRVASAWADGLWQVDFEFPTFPELDLTRRLAVAVWQGAERERAGLKSVSTAWSVLD